MDGKDLAAILQSSYTIEIGPARDKVLLGLPIRGTLTLALTRMGPARDKVHDTAHGLGDYDLKSTEVGQAFFEAQQEALTRATRHGHTPPKSTTHINREVHNEDLTLTQTQTLTLTQTLT